MRTILILISCLVISGLSCRSGSISIDKAFSYALAQDSLCQDYLYFYSDDRAKLKNISNEFFKSEDRGDFIDTFYQRNKNSNNYLRSQTFRYKKNGTNSFSVIRNGVNGFRHSLEIDGDTVLFKPDPSSCPKRLPCEFKILNVWHKGEVRGIFRFEGFETLKIGKNTFRKSIVLKMNTENNEFVRFWIQPGLGIIKTYSNTYPVYTEQLLAKLLVTKDVYRRIKNPPIM